MATKVYNVDMGYRPHRFQEEAYGAAMAARFLVLVCHRRWGKTVFAVVLLICKAMNPGKRDFQGAYIAPFRKQAKDVAWLYFKRFTRMIPGVKYNESELCVTFPTGTKITLYGTDNADALRGLYLDYAVLDEVADMAYDTWGSVIRPTLLDRKGGALFIGTPKGMNLFFELYNKGAAGDGKRWRSLSYPASKTVDVIPWITQEEISDARNDMNASQFRQEMECDFNASTENSLISLDLLYEARGKHIPEREYIQSPLIFGVDVARFGGDASVIFRRQGLAAFTPERHVGIDNMDFAGMIHAEIVRERPDAVFIDAGRGEGVIDRLRQLMTPAPVIEVPFGGKAVDGGDNGYANRRIEMWDTMRKWLESGGAIPDDYDLVKELATPTYSFDAKNRKVLEKKEDIRARAGFSPDRADALALTFAAPVCGIRGENTSGRTSELFADDRFSI